MTSRTSLDFPTPASPVTSTAPPWPRPAASSPWVRALTSAFRPMSTGHSIDSIGQILQERPDHYYLSSAQLERTAARRRQRYVSYVGNRSRARQASALLGQPCCGRIEGETSSPGRRGHGRTRRQAVAVGGPERRAAQGVGRRCCRGSHTEDRGTDRHPAPTEEPDPWPKDALAGRDGR